MSGVLHIVYHVDYKRLLFELAVLWLIVMDTFQCGSALKCWQCIAHDCENDPEDNYKASRIDCTDGRQCMKVRYRMFDNITHYDSVIRTCTDQPCQQNSTYDFEKCVATPKQYMIGGCTLRSCCADRDFCNQGIALHSCNHNVTKILVLVIVALTIM